MQWKTLPHQIRQHRTVLRPKHILLTVFQVDCFFPNQALFNVLCIMYNKSEQRPPGFHRTLRPFFTKWCYVNATSCPHGRCWQQSRPSLSYFLSLRGLLFQVNLLFKYQNKIHCLTQNGAMIVCSDRY